MKLETGQEAPSFSLYDSEKKKKNLEDFRGKNILLLFFPLAFTSTCTKELCEVRDNISAYDRVNAEVMGISVDSLYTLAKFKEEQRLNFTLLSDFNKQVSEAYGSIYELFGFEMRGVSKRSAFVIDGQGILRYIEVLEDAKEVPDFIAIGKILNSLG
jgi:glutaredoxin-dependent peroxiredoxin